MAVGYSPLNDTWLKWGSPSPAFRCIEWPPPMKSPLGGPCTTRVTGSFPSSRILIVKKQSGGAKPLAGRF